MSVGEARSGAWAGSRKEERGAYGAMMTLALEMGSSFPSTVVGTLSRYSSSAFDRTAGLPSYQLPAWVASRVPFWGMVLSGLYAD